MNINPTPSEESSSAFQYVPVPNEHVGAVYQLLSSLSSAAVHPAIVQVASSEPDRIQTAFDAADAVWTESRLARIAAGSYTSTVALSEILDLISEEPGWYTQNELADRTGRSLDQYRIVWAKLTPHFEKHYDTKTWPLIGFGGDQLTPPRKSTLIHFTTTPQISVRWKEVRGR